MSVTGLCQLCERAEATQDCDRCGALVCADHWNADTGYCAECAAELGRSGGPDSRRSPERDTFQF